MIQNLRQSINQSMYSVISIIFNITLLALISVIGIIAMFTDRCDILK